MDTTSLQRVSRWSAIGAAVLLIVVLVFSAVDLARGHPPSWSSVMLLLGMSLGIGGALLREPRWQIPLNIASLTATLIAASGLIEGR
jgi:hypothetical protein